MHFQPYGPFELPRFKTGLISTDKNQQKGFWQEIEEVEEGLSSAVGCYIFSVRAGRGVLPWYVGMAEKQSFSKECFQPHKINHYNNSIAARKGTPLLTFLPKLTPNKNFSKVCENGHREIKLLEKLLIGSAILRNRNLRNIKDTKILREMIVPGIINTPIGGQSSTVIEFRSLLGL